MNSKLPERIIRTDDGVEFVLNPATNRYSPKLGIPHLDDRPSFDYSYEHLISLPGFKVADGTEDLEAMREAWIDSFKDRNDGHGNEHE